MENGLVRRVLPRAEQPTLVSARIGEERKRLIRMRRQHDLVEAAGLAVLGDDLDPRVVSPDRSHAQTEMNLAAQAFQHRGHVRVGAAFDGSPTVPPKAEHAVALEEADPVRGRKVESALRRARPERGRQRHQEVTAEASRVPALVDVRPEGSSLEAPVLERLLRRSQPADDFRQEREEAGIREPPPLRERPATGPLESAVAAAHRERHLRAAGRHAELAEQTAEDGVVGLVVDDEARVEREPAVPDGVYVTAGAVMLLEQLHLMSLGQHMRRPEPRHACTDDSYMHRTGIRRAANFG